MKNGSLIFNILQAEDEGEYKCEAKNDVGSPLEKIISLSVQGMSSIMFSY